MTYEPRKNRYATPMGDTVSDLVKCSQTVIGGAIGGAADPYLPEALCRITQLQALRKDRTPLQAMLGKKPTVAVPVCVPVPLGRPGIGVEKVIKPLRGLVYIHQHPTTVWLGLAALLGVPMFVGYMIGRGSR